MKEKRNDICSAIAFIAFAVFLFVGSYWIPPTTSDILGSRFFPRMIAFLIAFLAVVQLIGAISFVKKGEVEKEKSSDKEGKNRLNMSLVLTVAALFAYYVLVLQIGFTITSIIYLLCQSAILMSKDDFKNKKKVVILALVAVFVPIFINTIFWKVFSIALPAGKLF
ncbi:tripartite tricarboxylate transporter TctB family protein [Clostridium sp. AM58-1XD]|uniref:tripartite tricarboxylate transporter TctB family protein n=1 Tax=Clostridium sp. AM58-1XD TaxID=2292307 RepID=UPI0015F5B958|nr:tripartite tricarboxylate transporter TctB family protein [Clostridium sp. AM58-1XD]